MSRSRVGVRREDVSMFWCYNATKLYDCRRGIPGVNAKMVDGLPCSLLGVTSLNITDISERKFILIERPS